MIMVWVFVIQYYDYGIVFRRLKLFGKLIVSERLIVRQVKW